MKIYVFLTKLVFPPMWKRVFYDFLTIKETAFDYFDLTSWFRQNFLLNVKFSYLQKKQKVLVFKFQSFWLLEVLNRSSLASPILMKRKCKIF